MGDSRNNLLAWLNDLSQLNYTKIEQCGSGAAYCVIMDSVYRDLSLSKVKFQAKHEYEYVANYKVLQACFDKHNIDNAIPVARLAKCKFQDNLEFLQWIKKYWDQYYPGGAYDALSRRKSEVSGSKSSLHSTGNLNKPADARKINSSDNDMSRAVKVPKSTNAGMVKARSELETEYQRIIKDLNTQVSELGNNMEQVTKEREFYFSKLREIEILVQQTVDSDTSGKSPDKHLKLIQEILYKTEDGFELPDEE